MVYSHAHMSSRHAYRLSSVFVLILVCSFAFAGNSALAAHSQKETGTATADPVKDATVNLYCRIKAGKKILGTTGSGVFISDRGIILTNAHVAQFFLLDEEKGRVTARCSVRAGSPAKERYTASVLYFPPDWVRQNASELGKNKPKGTGKDDFALLSVTGSKKGMRPERFPVLPIDLAANLQEEAPVTIAGYPAEKLDFDGVRTKLAIVTASSTVTNIQNFGQSTSADILTIAPSDAGSSGISGGPIINNAGEVIGIVTSKGAKDNDRTLRAITLSYIDRTIRTQTILPLRDFLSGDSDALAKQTSASRSPDILKTIVSALLKKK